MSPQMNIIRKESNKQDNSTASFLQNYASDTIIKLRSVYAILATTLLAPTWQCRFR